ncbi:MAG: hypothetical protein ACTHZ9_03390 [Leucobacter sp.]
MDDIATAYIAAFAIWAGGALFGLLVLWAVIRSAVLSALRKHSDDNS